MLLAFVCSIIGFLFYKQLSSLGSYGRLVGWVLALVYFTPLNSELGKGQTVGKRVQKIKVVDAEGKFINIGRSFVRSLILTTPFLLNGFWVPTNDLHPSLWMYVLGFFFSLVVFGGILSILYLYLFNRKTRQSLHDLIAGTFVVNAATQPAVIEARTAPIHKIVAGALCALAAILPLAFLHSDEANALLGSPLMAAYTSVQSMPEISSAGVVDQTFSTHMMTGDNAGKQQSKEVIVVSAMLKYKPDDFEQEATRIADKVLQQPDVLNGKPLGISVSSGIDLGLASWHERHNYEHTADEWKEMISKLPK